MGPAARPGEIAQLVVADAAALWVDLGFAVTDGDCWVSGVCLRLGGQGTGITAWAWRGLDDIGELPVAGDPSPAAQPTPEHSNGVVALDHVVVLTPDLDRTVGAFEAGGVGLRRARDAGTPGHPMRQAFFTLGPVVVEVVGPPVASGPGPARFWGLAFTVGDLDATASWLGPRLRPARDAVQPGRRIATLDRAVGSTVPLAFMSGP